MSRIFDAMAKSTSPSLEPAFQSLLTEHLEQPEARQSRVADTGAVSVKNVVPSMAAVLTAPVPESTLKPPVTKIRTLTVSVQKDVPVLPLDQTPGAAIEQYRMIRTRILQHPTAPRVILVTSSGAQDGKSVTAINLAGSFALKSEARVVLIDGDLRRGSIHTKLGLPSSPGLRDVLQGECPLEEALIHTTQLPNLYVLTCGENKGNASELLDSSAWRRTCETLLKSFDYVILDSPPIAAVADYDLLQNTCDGVVIIARPDHSSRKLFLSALKSIPKNKLLGVVLNHTPDWFLAKRNQSEYGYY